MSIVLNKTTSDADLEASGLVGYSRYLKLRQEELLSSYHSCLKREKEGLNKNYELLVEQTRADLIRETSELSTKLYADSCEKFKSFLSELEGEMAGFVTNVLTKLGVFNVSANHVASLLKMELISFINRSSDVSIKANADTINYLKFCMNDDLGAVDYELDDSIVNGSCVVSDGKFMIFTDIVSAIDKVKEIIRDNLSLRSNQDEYE